MVDEVYDGDLNGGDWDLNDAASTLGVLLLFVPVKSELVS